MGKRAQNTGETLGFGRPPLPGEKINYSRHILDDQTLGKHQYTLIIQIINLFATLNCVDGILFFGIVLSTPYTSHTTKPKGHFLLLDKLVPALVDLEDL